MTRKSDELLRLCSIRLRLLRKRFIWLNGQFVLFHELFEFLVLYFLPYGLFLLIYKGDSHRINSFFIKYFLWNLSHTWTLEWIHHLIRFNTWIQYLKWLALHNDHIVFYSARTNLAFIFELILGIAFDWINAFLAILKMLTRNEHHIDLILFTKYTYFTLLDNILIPIVIVDLLVLFLIIIGIELLLHFLEFLWIYQINHCGTISFITIDLLLILVFFSVLMIFISRCKQQFIFLRLNVNLLKMAYILAIQSSDLKYIIDYLWIESKID